jgi:xanthine dehydrogenase YagR molybdenum-binding subunit
MTTTLEQSVGAPVARIEGVAKVCGQARYAAEYPLPGLAYGSVVASRIARGRIRRVDADAALGMPGVLAVLDYRSAPRLRDIGDNEAMQFQDDVVHYRGQAVALVVAQTLEQARAAADALPVEYDAEPHDVLLSASHPKLYRPDHVNPADEADTHKGDVEAALARSPVIVDSEYSTPAEHNNPMEPHAATVYWDAGRLIAYDSNQGAARIHQALAGLFGLEPSAVQVLSEHVGGGFGAKGAIRLPVIAAAMAALVTGRPVRVVLTRQQLFSMVGYRTPTLHRVRLGADADGTLVAVDHLVCTQTSTVLEFAEQAAVYARVMYATPNLRTRHRIAALDVPTPRWMRGPGEAPGAFAIESAMDELAAAAGIDPVELRIRNDPDVTPDSGLPFSSRSVVECLRKGAGQFGWASRDPRPGVRRDGRWLVGSGVASGTYPANTAPSTASATAEADGSYTVRITASDVGTGARTALTQVAADELRVPLDRVKVLIGNSDYGPAMIAAGSMGTASWSFAVVSACRALTGLLDAGAQRPVEARSNTAGELGGRAKLARYSFGAQFAEVRVDTDTGEVRVSRLLGVFAAGRIVNPRTARSQLIGGMTWGLSMALLEESVLDQAYGDYANHDFAGYHIPVHADVPPIEADWVDEADDQLNPSGVKGIGEVCIVGSAAAIANAVWHATGIRQRQLPIRPDRVLMGGGPGLPDTADISPVRGTRSPAR